MPDLGHESGWSMFHMLTSDNIDHIAAINCDFLQDSSAIFYTYPVKENLTNILCLKLYSEYFNFIVLKFIVPQSLLIYNSMFIIFLKSFFFITALVNFIVACNSSYFCSDNILQLYEDVT